MTKKEGPSLEEVLDKANQFARLLRAILSAVDAFLTSYNHESEKGIIDIEGETEQT